MRQRDTLWGIQILRGAGAMAVVAHHAMEEADAIPSLLSLPRWLTMTGAAGVDIFFVISGFIMVHTALPAGGAPDTPGRFLVRRALRIYPFYWVCVLAMAMAALSAGVVFSGDAIAASIALLPHPQRILWVAWTLVCEMIFYVLFAACLPLATRGRVVPATIAAIGAGYMLHIVLPEGGWRTYLSNPIMIEFGLGMLLAWAHAHRALQARWLRHGWIAGCALIMLASLSLPSPTTHELPGWSRIWGWGLPALLIVASLSRPGIALAAGRLRTMGLTLGDASYAIYLTHGFVMIVYARMLDRVPAGVAQWAMFGAAILLSALAGIAAHNRIERPLMARLARRRGGMVPRLA